MGNTPQPAPSQRKGQLVTLAILVAVLSVPIVFGWLNTIQDDEPASLCDMLRAGWTVDELADSDHWRAWPASMSRTERGFTVLREAGRECPDLVGQ